MPCLGAGEEQARGTKGACLPLELNPQQVNMHPEVAWQSCDAGLRRQVPIPCAARSPAPSLLAALVSSTPMSVPAKQSPARLSHAFSTCISCHPLGSHQVPARSHCPAIHPHPTLTQRQHLGRDLAEAEVGNHVCPVSYRLEEGESVPASPGASRDVEPGVLTRDGLR